MECKMQCIISFLQTEIQQNQIQIIFCLMFITMQNVFFFQVHNLGRVYQWFQLNIVWMALFTRELGRKIEYLTC